MQPHDIHSAIFAAIAKHEDDHHSDNPARTFMAIQPFHATIDHEEGEQASAAIIGIAQHESVRDLEGEPLLQFIAIVRNDNGLMIPRIVDAANGPLPYQGTTSSNQPGAETTS